MTLNVILSESRDNLTEIPPSADTVSTMLAMERSKTETYHVAMFDGQLLIIANDSVVEREKYH